MCGIIGSIGRSRNDVLQKKMLASIVHRGPDGLGSWNSPYGEEKVWLGHTRLSILDTSHLGNQPMHSGCGRWVITFNGEIYNFLELRKELQDNGVEFKTQTDTEVFLNGLIIFGPQFQLQCNGMWAFCLWDRLECKAILGRDRFGKKPLFYSKTGKEFIFSSEMKGLYPIMKSVQPSLQIDNYFADTLTYESTEGCVVDGIMRIPAGTWLEWHGNKITLNRWWCTLDHLVDAPVRYEEQVEKFRELFLDAVKIRMRADVRIGTALSGGLDSSSTFCSMAQIDRNFSGADRLSSDWQHGVCAGFPGSEFDETHMAKLVTNFIGVPLKCVDINPAKSSWSIEEALWQTEDPYMTLPLPHIETYRAISDLGIKVTLDGHGADELFCGYVHLHSAFPNATSEQVAELLAIERSMSGLPYNISHKGVVAAKINERIKTILRPLLNTLRGRTTLTYADQNHPAYKNMDYLTRVLYELFHVTSLPTLLRNYDRYSMASGVEIRMPFMDHRLVTFIFSLPWTSKVGGGYTKRLLRDAMKGIVPDEIRLNRTKHGWNSPMHEWLRGPLHEEMLWLRNSGKLNVTGICKIDEFELIEQPTFSQATAIWNSVLLPAFWRKSLHHTR